MTNAEKYLKDGIIVEQFAEELTKKISRWDDLSYYSDGIEKDIIEYLNEPITPTLTEDERIILKNIKLYVGRRMNGELFFTFENREDPYIKGELFQFIKERRRIRDKGVVKMIEKIKMAKYGSTFTMEQLIREITLKQDEIIDKVNELDIKLHTVKFFPPKNDKAIKDLLKLLEADNSVGNVIND